MATNEVTGEGDVEANDLLIEGTFYCQGKLATVQVQEGAVQWTCKGKSRLASLLRLQGRIQDLIGGGGVAQIVTGLKLPFWGLSFVEFWCWGLIFGGQGGGPGPPGPPLDPPLG